MSTKEVTIQETVDLNICGETAIIKFPSKISQQLEIEANKGLLSMGKYSVLSVSMNHVTSTDRILDTVDMMAHFMVVVPDFIKLIGLSGDEKMIDMEKDKADPLVKEYNTKYARFYNQFVSMDERIGPYDVKAEAAKKFDKKKTKPTAKKSKSKDTEKS